MLELNQSKEKLKSEFLNQFLSEKGKSERENMETSQTDAMEQGEEKHQKAKKTRRNRIRTTKKKNNNRF